MSSIDKMTANEQLFTELTPEEGAVVEGGATHTLIIGSLKAINPNSFSDDPMIMVGSKIVFKAQSVQDNESVLSKPIRKTISTNETLSLWDEDFSPFADDDLLGFTQLTGPTNGFVTRNWGGYQLRYKVI